MALADASATGYTPKPMTPEQRAAAPGLRVADYNVCCALGMNRAAVLQALQAAQAGDGLTRAPFDLEFEAPSGVLPDALPALPARFADHDTRQARLALAALEPLRPSLARCLELYGKRRVALVLGSSNAGLDRTEAAFSDFLASGQPPQGYSLRTQHEFAAVLRLICAITGIEGPAHVVSTACSSSGKALASAARMLQLGIVDAALVGGVDALCEMTLRGFKCLDVLSEQPCRPFGLTPDGINIGEGAALFVLERSNAPGLVLLGTGETNDAHHMTAPAPDGEGCELAMQQALAEAGLAPDAIDFINAHGTGTPQGDRAEAQAIARIFGARVPVFSSKAYTGHALGAAGAIEAALCLLCLEAGWLPASLGAQPRDPTLGIEVVAQPGRRVMRHALSNSCAFGGSNVSVVLGQRS